MPSSFSIGYRQPSPNDRVLTCAAMVGRLRAGPDSAHHRASCATFRTRPRQLQQLTHPLDRHAELGGSRAQLLVDVIESFQKHEG